LGKPDPVADIALRGAALLAAARLSDAARPQRRGDAELMALLKRTLDNVRYPLSRPGRVPQRGAADRRWAATHVSGR